MARYAHEPGEGLVELEITAEDIGSVRG